MLAQAGNTIVNQSQSKTWSTLPQMFVSAQNIPLGFDDESNSLPGSGRGPSWAGNGFILLFLGGYAASASLWVYDASEAEATMPFS